MTGTTCVSSVQCSHDPWRKSPPFEVDGSLPERLRAGDVVVGSVEDELEGIRYFAALALDVSESSRPLLFLRSRRRLGERELLELIGPPLSAHSRHARTHRLLAGALASLADSTKTAVIVLDPAEKSHLHRRSPGASSQKHFDDADLPARLKSELRRRPAHLDRIGRRTARVLAIEALGPTERR